MRQKTQRALGYGRTSISKQSKSVDKEHTKHRVDRNTPVDLIFRYLAVKTFEVYTNFACERSISTARYNFVKRACERSTARRVAEFLNKRASASVCHCVCSSAQQNNYVAWELHISIGINIISANGQPIQMSITRLEGRFQLVSKCSK